MCRRCEICCGPIEHGVCINCGLPVDIYLPDNVDDCDECEEDERDDRTLHRSSYN